METLTKEFFVEQFDSFRTDVKKEFDSVRSEMATKKDLESLRKEFDSLREKMATKEDIESLAEMTSRSFTTVALDFVRLEAQVHTLEEKIDTFVDIDYRGQIDVLRDEVRVIKTRLGIA